MDHKMDEQLKNRYLSYCQFGDKSNHGTMESKTFAKLCKECDLLNKTCTGTDIDLIFTKVKTKGARRIEYKQFLEGLKEVAARRFKADDPAAGFQKCVEHIVNHGGPQSTGTKADFVKFHDDKSTYTGVYARGGPTNVDNNITLSNLADRSASDARGIKK